MRILLSMVAWFAMFISSNVMAQSWILYAPPEGDFRVLLPAPPSRSNVAESGVEFHSIAGTERFSVIRYDARQAAAVDQARLITMRRIGDGDRQPRDVGYDKSDLLPNEFELRLGRSRSMHRIVLESGRYYELMVQSDDDDGLSRDTARDFFNSFQMGMGLGRGFGVLGNIPTPQTCQTRPNALSRRLCEYLTCLAPGQEANPVCVALPRLTR